jgi:hypothetical protein
VVRRPRSTPEAFAATAPVGWMTIRPSSLADLADQYACPSRWVWRSGRRRWWYRMTAWSWRTGAAPRFP